MAKKVIKRLNKKEKKLTTSELIRISLDDEKRKYAELDLKSSKLLSENHQLELKIIELEYKLKATQIDKLGDIVQTKSEKIEGLLNSREDFVNSIQDRLKLKSKWGFNPTTGLVKED